MGMSKQLSLVTIRDGKGTSAEIAVSLVELPISSLIDVFNDEVERKDGILDGLLCFECVSFSNGIIRACLSEKTCIEFELLCNICSQNMFSDDHKFDSLTAALSMVEYASISHCLLGKTDNDQPSFFLPPGKNACEYPPVVECSIGANTEKVQLDRCVGKDQKLLSALKYELDLPGIQQTKVFNRRRSFVGALFENENFVETLQSLFLAQIAESMTKLGQSPKSIMQLNELPPLSSFSQKELPTSRCIEMEELTKQAIRQRTKRDCKNQHDRSLFRGACQIFQMNVRAMNLPGELPGGFPTDFYSDADKKILLEMAKKADIQHFIGLPVFNSFMESKKHEGRTLGESYKKIIPSAAWIHVFSCYNRCENIFTPEGSKEGVRPALYFLRSRIKKSKLKQGFFEWLRSEPCKITNK